MSNGSFNSAVICAFRSIALTIFSVLVSLVQSTLLGAHIPQSHINRSLPENPKNASFCFILCSLFGLLLLKARVLRHDPMQKLKQIRSHIEFGL